MFPDYAWGFGWGISVLRAGIRFHSRLYFSTENSPRHTVNAYDFWWMIQWLCRCLNPFRLLYQKHHILGSLETTNIYFSQFWRLGNPKSWHWQVWSLVRICFLDSCRWCLSRWRLFTVTPHGERVKWALLGLFYKGTNPTHEVSVLMS